MVQWENVHQRENIRAEKVVLWANSIYNKHKYERRDYIKNILEGNQDSWITFGQIYIKKNNLWLINDADDENDDEDEDEDDDISGAVTP